MLKNKKVEYILSREKYDFYDLCAIMEILRGEGGCPWDTEQTHESIRKNFIEETYEVIEAINTKNSDLLREELGDVYGTAVSGNSKADNNGTKLFSRPHNAI